jgi:hypothetical protein
MTYTKEELLERNLSWIKKKPLIKRGLHNNPDYMHQYYLIRREELIKRAGVYKKAHPDKVKIWAKKWREKQKNEHGK